mgnify:FL=1
MLVGGYKQSEGEKALNQGPRSPIKQQYNVGPSVGLGILKSKNP